MYENQYGTDNAAYLRDPASAITQRKYALAQALQKQGMDTSPVVGTGNNTMQALARVLQGGIGAYLGSRVEDEAKDYSNAQRDERQQAQAAILALASGQAPPQMKGPEVPEGASPMPQRLGGAPPATPQDRAEIEGNPLLSPGGRDLNGRPFAPIQPVAQGGAMPPPGDPRRYAALLAQRDANLGADPATLAQASAARGATGAPQIAGGYASPPGVAGQFAGLAPPSGVINPTIGGTPGAAARTGGTDMAGPGIPQGPPAEGATSPKPTPPGDQRTPEQLRRDALLVGSLNAPGAAQAAAQLNSRAEAIERRQFQSENTTETRRLQGELRDERAAERAAALRLQEQRDRNSRLPQGYEYGPDNKPRRIEVPTDPNAGPMQGNAIEAQDENRLLRGDPASREYLAAYTRQGTVRRLPDGSEIRPDMRPYRKPTFVEPDAPAPAAGAPPATPTEPGTPTTTAPTQMNIEQGKVATFADRMHLAMPNIETMATAGTSRRDRAASSIPVIGNSLVSSDFQQAQQAERNFITATLRRESGASISPEEYATARQVYIPQPGDGEKVLKDKKDAREALLNGFEREAGGAYKRPKPPEPAAAAGGNPPAPPKVGEVRRGYRFKGGEAGDETAWEKVTP